MTDKELCEFGERLYGSVLYTPLSAATLFNLGIAVRQALPWSALPQSLRFAVFKIAAGCVDAGSGSGQDREAGSAADAGSMFNAKEVQAPSPAGRAEPVGKSELIARSEGDVLDEPLEHDLGAQNQKPPK